MIPVDGYGVMVGISASGGTLLRYYFRRGKSGIISEIIN
jgi:hypothetical protein